MSIYKNQKTETILNELTTLNHLIDPHRTSACGYALYVTKHATDDLEITARFLQNDEALFTKGGGKRQNTTKQNMDERVLRESIRRSRKNIRTACLNLQVDRILTLTFQENITDLSIAWKVFNKFSKLMTQKFNKRWRYVVVPEYQRRGAVHFHLAISGYLPVITSRNYWLKAITTISGQGGSLNMTNPADYRKNNTSWNPKRIVDYISKYISKQDQVEFNRKRYSKGGDIPEPIKLFGWIVPGTVVETIIQNISKKLSNLPITTLVPECQLNRITYATTLF